MIHHQFQKRLGILQLFGERDALGRVVEQRDEELRPVVLIAHQNTIVGENAGAAAAADVYLSAGVSRRRFDGTAIGGLDRGSRFGRVKLIGAFADDGLACEARKSLESPVGENVPAVFNVLRGDTHRNVVDNRFKEAVRGRELFGKIALLGAILMRRDGTAVRQHVALHQNRAAIDQFDNRSMGLARISSALADDFRNTAAPAQREQFRAGQSRCDIAARKTIDFKISVVAKDDLVIPVDDHNAMAERIQGRRHEGGAAREGALDPVQGSDSPERDGDQKAKRDDRADDELP